MRAFSNPRKIGSVDGPEGSAPVDRMTMTTTTAKMIRSGQTGSSDRHGSKDRSVGVLPPLQLPSPSPTCIATSSGSSWFVGVAAKAREECCFFFFFFFCCPSTEAGG
jgi:hypothetical protein